MHLTVIYILNIIIQQHIIRLRPCIVPRTDVPLSRSLVFIASDGMLMALYKVVTISFFFFAEY